MEIQLFDHTGSCFLGSTHLKDGEKVKVGDMFAPTLPDGSWRWRRAVGVVERLDRQALLIYTEQPK